MPKRSDGTQPQPAGGANAPTDDMGFTPMSALTIEHDGAALYPSAALSTLAAIESALLAIPTGQAGVRLNGIRELTTVLEPGTPIANIATIYIGTGARPVRAVLFDKSPDANWALGWHQDRTIAVRRRCDVPGFGPWSIKRGIQHVEPPFATIEAMVTLRIHLDPVPIDNAPLLIARGSHRIGRIAADQAETIATRMPVTACLADRGDVWAYATPILHASAASNGHSRRRALQVDYAASDLPGRLEWLGV